jgi:hypothetical protein
LLKGLQKGITFQFIPSRCGAEGNKKTKKGKIQPNFCREINVSLSQIRNNNKSFRFTYHNTVSFKVSINTGTKYIRTEIQFLIFHEEVQWQIFH